MDEMYILVIGGVTRNQYQPARVFMLACRFGSPRIKRIALDDWQGLISEAEEHWNSVVSSCRGLDRQHDVDMTDVMEMSPSDRLELDASLAEYAKERSTIHDQMRSDVRDWFNQQLQQRVGLNKDSIDMIIAEPGTKFAPFLLGEDSCFFYHLRDWGTWQGVEVAGDRHA